MGTINKSNQIKQMLYKSITAALCTSVASAIELSRQHDSEIEITSEIDQQDDDRLEYSQLNIASDNLTPFSKSDILGCWISDGLWHGDSYLVFSKDMSYRHYFIYSNSYYILSSWEITDNGIRLHHDYYPHDNWELIPEYDADGILELMIKP